MFYSGDAEFQCESSNFTSITQTLDGGNILLEYTSNVESLNASAQIVIKCTNWRNPVTPSLVTGFSILTFNTNRAPIDFSSDLIKIDATEFIPMQINDQSFDYHLSHHHANELSDYLISFDAGLPIDA